MGYQAADGIIMSWPGRKQSSPEILCMTHLTNGTHGVSWFQLQKSWSWFAFINWIENVSILKRFGNETVSNDFFGRAVHSCNFMYVNSFHIYIYVYITGRYYRRYSGFFSNRRFAFWASLHQTVQIEEFMIDLPNSSIWNVPWWSFFGFFSGQDVLEHFPGRNWTTK